MQPPPSGAGAVGVQPGSRPLLTQPLQLWFNLSTFPVFFFSSQEGASASPSLFAFKFDLLPPETGGPGKGISSPKKPGSVKDAAENPQLGHHGGILRPTAP